MLVVDLSMRTTPEYVGGRLAVVAAGARGHGPLGAWRPQGVSDAMFGDRRHVG
jgi:hypothetical protein